MKPDLIEALDESLALLETGQATPEECLARYTDHADDLRPLLETAAELSRVPPPVSSPDAFAGGKRRMLEALVGRRHHRVAWPRAPLRFAERIFAPFVRRTRPVGWRRAPVWALGVACALALIVFGAVLLPSWLRPAVTEAATLGQVSGVVEIQSAAADGWRSASAGESVEEGDRLRTRPLSGATLVFFDGSTTDLEGGTEVALMRMSALHDDGARVILLHQASGRTYSRVQPLPDPASRFEIETPTALAAVRGTEFALDVEADGTTRVVVVEGVVNVTAQETTVVVPGGQETAVQPEQPPDPVRPATSLPAPTPTAAPRLDKAPKAPGRTKTPEPPGRTKTPEPPGRTKTRQPPGRTRTPEPPGRTKTRQPPGRTRTPQPPGRTRTPQPPGRTRTPHAGEPLIEP